ncbi:DNA-primase RepB domain-containing protein [Phaeobacter marinintestinus]|uniref:DNA-primase RepB domain-containing protein n=1 Tax=Falsiphaeobacter marinintestinus TaxID=1492905 RepID=UPI0011B80D03|nr:DNA-primase RepB domain-containing protein [Phaeobacter marinintestinus]
MRNRVSKPVRPNERHTDAFTDYNDDKNIRRSMVGFLCCIWDDAPKDSFLFLATTSPDGSKWREHVVRTSKVKADVNRFLRKYSRWDHNLYFGVNPFSQDRRLKEHALPSSLGWCDMDDSDPDAYLPQPNLLWETSPDRFQALWLWDSKYEVEDAERFSRSLADNHGGDSGWTVTKMLRIPGSINHKPHYEEPFVRMVSQDWKRTAKRPKLVSEKRRLHDMATLSLDMNPNAHKRLDVWRKYRSKLSVSARTVIRHSRVLAPDRSKWIFVMVTELCETGATLDEIASVIWDSPYFLDKYGQNRKALERQISNIINKTGG